MNIETIENSRIGAILVKIAADKVNNKDICGGINNLINPVLSKKDYDEFDRLLILNLYNHKCSELINIAGEIYLNNKNLNKNLQNRNKYLPVKISYYMTKLLKINELLYTSGLKDKILALLIMNKNAGETQPHTKNNLRLVLWYLLKCATIKEINTFNEYLLKTAPAEKAIKLLIEESFEKFKPVMDDGGALTRLELLKIHYKNESEILYGQARRDAEYKYYVICDYIDLYFMNWSFLNKSAADDDNFHLYDALKCRFNSMKIAYNDNKNKKNPFNTDNHEIFSHSAYNDFISYFNNKNRINETFIKLAETKKEKIFIKYKNAIYSNFTINTINSLTYKIIYEFVQICAGEMNAAESAMDNFILYDPLFSHFTNIKTKADEMLKKHILSYINETVIIEQIIDGNLKTTSRFISFKSDMSPNEEIIDDNKLKALASKFNALHVIFTYFIDKNSKTIKELCRMITPSYDSINKRAILHSDFAPLDVSYAKGVIINGNLFEYDKFNTWYAGKDKIHRSESNNPFTAAIIKRMLNDIKHILNQKA